MLKRKKALITGISGQDGSYLAEYLYSKGYNVHGVDRSFAHLPSQAKNIISELHEIDLTKPKLLNKLIKYISPDEIYHLAACHFSSQNNENIKMSFEPFNSINLLATNEILDTIRHNFEICRFFYASSCHIFGKVDHYPQNEKTPYRPDSFYSITKAAGNELCKLYRDHHGVYASVGILYNHESPRRPLSFVTSQIAEAAAKASHGIKVKLTLRDLDATVDWGAAQDYVHAMWLTLQQPCSDDYVIASGVPRRVYEFSKAAFDYVGLNVNNFIFQDEAAIENEGLQYVGDPSKIQSKCGWYPAISFNDLIIDMVKAHIDRLKMN
ncbi:MAG TPA: GDP-mannose 4,6-dehydratase [Syntrophales bacterium]|nr:GDP-mannose 4,6-dehydratase [Syntrophales bacterium]